MPHFPNLFDSESSEFECSGFFNKNFINTKYVSLKFNTQMELNKHILCEKTSKESNKNV